jgi:hypothetical protein
MMSKLKEILICDECDTLATVSVESDTITISQCQCLTLDWNN